VFSLINCVDLKKTSKVIEAGCEEVNENHAAILQAFRSANAWLYILCILFVMSYSFHGVWLFYSPPVNYRPLKDGMVNFIYNFHVSIIFG